MPTGRDINPFRFSGPLAPEDMIDRDPESEDLHTHLNTVDTPLNALGEKTLCPGSATLDKINASLR